ncbi:hypothetical protein HPP92_013251 [Vanilla planifolia]|uniref:AB hydrolase-1 domain-containing protein n=1 Tax=Vanilla planifolia TaxID=51239 RepID=A0A835R1L0_VANPL|nr:hypothetical protein HPP92_013251 [Vanilla planifolia]
MDGVVFEHRTVQVNGISMHLAEKGQGPLVLFPHGFPELWYSWRHQILSLATRGYRAVAPDLRGYGDTDAPPDVSAYTIFHLVGDIVALIDSLGQENAFVVGHGWGAVLAWNLCLLRPDRVRALVNLSVPFPRRNPLRRPVDSLRAHYGAEHYICRFQVFVVGHDWGAIVAWNLCLFRPDIVRALVNLSVAFTPRNPLRRPLDSLRAFYGADHYICRFQELGEAEAEFARLGANFILRKFLTYHEPAPLLIPKKGFGGTPDEEIILSSWLSNDDINYYTSKFERSGFTGGLNYYRNLNRNWELTASWTGVQIKVPVKFIVGDLDLSYHVKNVKDYIHKGGFKRDVPFLQELVIMEGVGHYINQERPDEISNLIYEFICKF